MDNITHTSTPTSLSGCSPASEGEPKCVHCLAPFGHYIYCPTINRNTAEAWSRVPLEIRINSKGEGVVS